jgi:hypothetical protein
MRWIVLGVLETQHGKQWLAGDAHAYDDGNDVAHLSSGGGDGRYYYYYYYYSGLDSTRLESVDGFHSMRYNA